MRTSIRTSGSVYVLAAGVVAFAVALPFLAGCPATGDGGGQDNGNGNDNTAEKAFVGAATCQGCHGDTHANWSDTAHAGALETLKGIGQGANAGCLPCHTVGFGLTDGFVDEATTPGLAGVQCENCHGPAGAHARDPGNRESIPNVDMSATLCGTCHTDFHHPTFDEWRLSRHSQALATLQSNSFARDECLECHSQDYRAAYNDAAGKLATQMQETIRPTLETAVLSIECVTCHQPHGGTGQAAQLRKPIADLCGECHTQEEATVGDTPHHPQIEMVRGVGALAADGSALEVSGPHTVLFVAGGQACAQCHVVRHDVAEPNEGEPVVTGHTFNPFDESITAHQASEYDGCLACHGSADAAAALRTAVQTDIGGRLEAISIYFDATNTAYINPAALSVEDAARLATAKFNYQFVGAEGSRGVHNADYADAVLDVAEGIVASLTGP